MNEKVRETLRLCQEQEKHVEYLKAQVGKAEERLREVQHELVEAIEQVSPTLRNRSNYEGFTDREVIELITEIMAAISEEPK